MKKLCMVLSLAGVMAASNLFAAMQVTLYQDTANYSDANGGGEFRAVGNSDLNNIVNWNAYNTGSTYNTAGVGDAYFQTFCTETAEYFSPGNTYPVTSIGNNALYDGTGHPVPITLGVAYLYSQFASGGLATYGYDYSYGSGRAASALNLQEAIWYLLGEYSDGAQLTGDALTALQHSGIAAADWTAAANGAYGVADMTLDNPGQAQDQLVMAVPEATTMIAGALLLLPLGASTVKILRNRKTSASL